MTTTARLPLFAPALLAAVFLALFTGPAAAEPVVERRLNLGISGEWFHYTEYEDAGSVLLRERGPLPGLFMELELTRGRWLVGGGGSYRDGDVEYDGRRMMDNQPVSSRTDERIWDGWLRAGRRFGPEEALNLDLFIGGGFRRWERDIRGTSSASGLFETYDTGYGFLESRVNKPFSDTLRGSAAVRLSRTVYPHMKVGFSDIGHFDMDLGEEVGVRVGATLFWDGWRGYELFANPYFEHWRFGRSDNHGWSTGGNSGFIYEPRSTTRLYGLQLGLSRPF